MSSTNGLGAEAQRSPVSERKRGFLLRLLYRVYTNYLGVTPPKPEQERLAAAFLIGSVIVFIVVGLLLVRFLWLAMASASGGR